MKIVAVYLSLIMVFSLTACIRSGSTAEPSQEYISVGMKVPSFTVQGKEGTEFVSPEDFEERTTLLLFFATWCPQCQAELPEVNAAWKALREESQYAVVAVARGGASGKYEQTPDILKEYWKAHGITMPWYLDTDRSVFDLFASADIPRLYIIDDTGTVVWKEVLPEMKAEEYLALLKKYGV